MLTDINICITVYKNFPECQKEQAMPIDTYRETPNPTPHAPPALSGRWVVVPQTSHVRFIAGTLAGLVKTPGRFRSISGNLVAGRRHGAGALVIDCSSIDTGNRLRDWHLRSRGFFDVRRHPQLRYEAHSISSPDPGSARIDGELIVADTRTPLPLDVTVHVPITGVVELSAHTVVDRVALGIRGARGMVPRTVEVDVAITLRRATP
jgi:polyisoprenoid-binding protein YceI